MSRTAFSRFAGVPIAAFFACAGFAGGCGNTDSRPAVWSYISPAILQPNCATSSCHSPAAAVAGLDFSDADSGYASLTRLHVLVLGDGGSGCGIADGVSVCERDLRPLVVPYDPNESRLVNMLRARNAPRMPPDRPLVEDDIRLIEKWILDGAKKNENETASPDASSDASPEATPDAGSSADGGATDGAEGGADAGPDSVTDAARETGG